MIGNKSDLDAQVCNLILLVKVMPPSLVTVFDEYVFVIVLPNTE